MRIQVHLPEVKPDEYIIPEKCPYPDCSGTHFHRHGKEVRPLQDLKYTEITCYRLKCTRCGRTFRIYPQGVTQAQQSQRLKGMSVFLYVLGVSYGGVSDFIRALGAQMSKSSAYYNTQAAGEHSRDRQQKRVAGDHKSFAIGADGSYITVKGEPVGVEVVVDDQTGDLLGLELVVSEKEAEIAEFILEIAQKVKAEVLVSDDLNVYKEIADEGDLAHQICQNHIIRNLEEIERSLLNQNDEPFNLFPAKRQQLVQDLNTLWWLVRDRPPDAKQFLAHLFKRYQHAQKPLRGKRHPVAYRMQRLIWRLWTRWDRITLNQQYPQLDGTNNASERAIGWWIKERYRTMRGYKRKLSVRNVVTLTALLGANPGFDMADLYR